MSQQLEVHRPALAPLPHGIPEPLNLDHAVPIGNMQTVNVNFENNFFLLEQNQNTCNEVEGMKRWGYLRRVYEYVTIHEIQCPIGMSR